MIYTMDDDQLLQLRWVMHCFAQIRESNDPVIQSEILTDAQILLTAFVIDLKPLVGDETSSVPPRTSPDQIVAFDVAKGEDLAMDSLSSGWTWLITMASALSPLIALAIGFAGADRLLRWQLAEKRDGARIWRARHWAAGPKLRRNRNLRSVAPCVIRSRSRLITPR